MEETLKINNPAINTEEKEENGSFTAVLRFLRRFIVLIVVLTVLGTAAGFGMGFMKSKTVYTQSKSVIFIARIEGKTMATNIQLTNKYVSTVKDEVKMPIFIQRANSIYESDYGGTYGGISAGAISIKTGDGLVFTFSYSDLNPDDAADKLDAFIEAAKIEIQGLLTADNAEFVPIQREPTTSSSNGFIKYVLLGVLGGLVASLSIAFLIYILDNTVSSKSDLEKLTGATVVAYIDDVVQ
ncbi:MAG: hypothetical protein IJQ87_02505 [Clostridia bacterium]|nr:hypothetical protein [Clostridia bacterium]